MAGSCARGGSPDASSLLTFPDNSLEWKIATGIRCARKKKQLFPLRVSCSGTDMWKGVISLKGMLLRCQGEERREGEHAVPGNIQGGPCSFSGA